MVEPLPAHEAPSPGAAAGDGGSRALARLRSFRVIYAAIFAFVLLSLLDDDLAESEESDDDLADSDDSPDLPLPFEPFTIVLFALSRLSLT